MRQGIAYLASFLSGGGAVALILCALLALLFIIQGGCS